MFSDIIFNFLCVGHGLEDLMTVNLARYKPTGERVAIRRIDMESCTNDMVKYLQVCSATISVSLYVRNKTLFQKNNQ